MLVERHSLCQHLCRRTHALLSDARLRGLAAACTPLVGPRAVRLCHHPPCQSRLGLVSFAALEAGRGWFLLLWRNPLGTVILYGALVSHVALALWSLYQRRRLHMSIWEAVQLLMGLTIPFLLTTHVVGTRLAHAWFDVQDSYAMWYSRSGCSDPILGWARPLSCSWPGCMAVLPAFLAALTAGYGRVCRGSLEWPSCYNPCLARIRAGRT